MRREDRAVLLVYALSWGLALLYYLSGGRHPNAVPEPGMVKRFVLFSLAYMWTPGLVAILLAWREGRRLSVWGRPNVYWLYAWLLPLLFAVLAVVLSLPLGSFQGLAGIKAQLPPALQNVPDLSLVSLLATQVLFAAATVNLVFALGEELFWRGYLFFLVEARGFWPASLYIGVVWGLWHAPLILMGHNYPHHPFAGVLMMTAFTVMATPTLLWLRLRGKSLIPPALFHGGLNAVGGLTVVVFKDANPLLVGLPGLGGLAAFALFNLWLRREVPNAAPGED